MYTFVKRSIDLFASSALLLVLTPLMIPVALALRFNAEGEVFYRQTRMGFRNRKFRILKFATMLKNSPNMLTGSLTVPDDPRVTSVGRFLRKTKINELPQIVNVLTGEMSLVGPRPQVEQDFMDFPEEIRKVIYNAKPGITGIGSIIFRDEESLFAGVEGNPRWFYRHHIAPYKGAVEVWYQRRASVLTDMTLIGLTVWYLFFPKSYLVFRVFRDLPELPEALSEKSYSQERPELVQFEH
jgi:lipopolysaccharide/colanic/teichoic acid biosynthesis glycosyltransferase